MARQKSKEREEKPDPARGHSGPQEDGRPTVEPPRNQQTERDNEARDDSHQAQQDVKESKRVQDRKVVFSAAWLIRRIGSVGS